MTDPDCENCGTYCVRNWRFLDPDATDLPKDHGPEETCKKHTEPKGKT